MFALHTPTLQWLTLLLAVGYGSYVLAAPGYLGRIAGVAGMQTWVLVDALVAGLMLLALLQVAPLLPRSVLAAPVWLAPLLWLFKEVMRRLLGHKPMTARRRWWLAMLCLGNLLLGLVSARWGLVSGALLAGLAGFEIARFVLAERARIERYHRGLLLVLAWAPAMFLLWCMALQFGLAPSRSTDTAGFAQLFALLLLVFGNSALMFLGFSQFARQLHAEGTRDAVVGILNRRGIMSEAEKLLLAASVEKQPLAVLMMDMDHFSRVNERAPYFHDGGDAVLRGAAKSLDAVVRQVNGTAGRYGGEEFLALAEVANQQEALALANRVRETIAAQAISYQDASYNVTCSIGVCFSSYRHPHLDRLIALADDGLYEAKANGRNRCVLRSA